MIKDPQIFLEHILESIDNIEIFSKNLSKEKLEINKLRQSAIIRQIEIIGEAIKNIPKSFTDKYPNIPWKDIVRMRDKIIHQHFNVDLDIVWGVIKIDLPELKKKVNEIIENSK